MSWDRVLAPVATVTLPVALVLLFFGQWLAALAGAVVLGLVLLTVKTRQRHHSATAWVASETPATAATEPARGSVWLALGPVEARELLLSPWFGAGVAFCVLFGCLGAQSFERSWWVTAGLMPLLVHPLCGMVIVATHRNGTRDRRDGTEELYESCPASSTQQTGAQLLTAVVPVGASVLFVSATLVAASIVLDDIYGPVDERVLTDTAIAGVLLPAGAIALGVLLGRRARFALAPFIAVACIAILDLEMWDRGLDGRGWLATGIASGGVDFIYFQPPGIGRLTWFLGLVILTAGLALSTSGWTNTRRIVWVGFVISVVGLVITTRPLSDATADRLTEYVIAPDAHEVCERLTIDVEVCALEPYKGHGANIAAQVAPVAAAIPSGTIDTPITMRLLAGEHLDQLPDQVQQRIEPIPIPPGTVAMPFIHHESGLRESRFLLAATAVGLPTGEDMPEVVLVDGQARGVVLLWLATAGLTEDAALDLLEPDEYIGDSPSARGEVWPATCEVRVQWAPQDVAAARSVVSLEGDTVADVVAREWDRWLTPTTTTDELLLAVGLAPVGPPDPIEPLGSQC